MKKYFLFFVFSTVFMVGAQKKVSVSSPDGIITLQVTISRVVEYSVQYHGSEVLLNSPVSMKLSNGMKIGVNPQLKKVLRNSVCRTISAKIYKKNLIEDVFNEVSLIFMDGFSLIFRVYNDGLAYRFRSDLKSSYEVKSEQVVYNFPVNTNAYIPYVNKYGGDDLSFEKQFQNSFENTYTYANLNEWKRHMLAFTPLMLEAKPNVKLCIAEADLIGYPGMFLSNTNASNSLVGVFAPYPKTVVQGGHNMLQGIVKDSESCIAKCPAKMDFPWRVLILSSNDFELLNNDMIYKLSRPSQLNDISWIKPGKVAWDWWNDWNIRHVDFKSGVNTQTYKYYIDFASKYGIEYVILDEGWAVNLKADLKQVIPDIDLKEIVSYAKSKNVEIILWTGYWAFANDIEGICKHYSEMGIRGFKVDFMDRDDQIIVDFLYNAASISAKYHLLLDFHGVYKPTGLQRTYPNVINFEGVHGLEQMKWAKPSVDQVTYDVTMPFIRMLAGPVDYTQGAMHNATKSAYYPNYADPMSQGTRCRQLAQYVIFESPLNMLCDNPSNYMQESECTRFISAVPTIWDQTISLNGEVGKYICLARQKDGVWYVASLTNWDARSMVLDLSFLGSGEYVAEVFKDGVNASRSASDYKRDFITIDKTRKIKIYMAPGGGFVMKISKRKIEVF